MPIPTQGFLDIYPLNTSSIVNHWALVSTPSPQTDASQAQIDAYYLTGVSDPTVCPVTTKDREFPPASGVYTPYAGTYEIELNQDTSRLIFDRAGTPTTIDFLSADFPMGCLISQLTIHWNGSWATGPNRDIQLTDISLKFSGSTVKTYTPIVGTNFSNSDIVSGSYDIIPFLNSWTPIQLFYEIYGFSATISAAVGSPYAAIVNLSNNLCYLEAVYNTNYYQFTLDTPNAIPGDIVQISGLHLDTLETFKVYWDTNSDNGDVASDIPGLSGGVTIPSGYFLIHIDTTLKFILPTNLNIPYGGRRLMIIATGTQFTGSLPIANLNISLVDGSGMYQLTDGQRHDTYYDRSTSPVTTTNLKIPDTFGRTGYY